MSTGSVSSPAYIEAGDDRRAQALAALEGEFNALVTQMRRTLQINASRVSDGMLPGAYKVLTTIARHGSATISSLTEEMMTDKGQMSRTVRELEERGLVTRRQDECDKRLMLLELSEFGAERLAEARHPQQSSLVAAMAEWPLEQIERFTDMMHALTQGVRPKHD